MHNQTLLNSFQPEVALTRDFTAAQAEAPMQLPSGGDFQNVFPLEDGSGDVAVVMGDVAGHSPQQTGQAEHMREMLSDCLAAGLAPAETLEAVNVLMEADPNFNAFGTVFVGLLEAGTGSLTYASGGHELGLIAAPDASTSGQVEQLEGTGPPVGALPPDMAEFGQEKAVLPAGATLLLYTDGVSEARSSGDRKKWLGTEGLKKIFARFSLLSPSRLVPALLGRVSAFCRGRFEDDISVMAVRRAQADAGDYAVEDYAMDRKQVRGEAQDRLAA